MSNGGTFGGSFGSYGGGMHATAQAAPAPAGGDLIKETTTKDFVRDVIEESMNQPVLVDFWAPWCGPCKQLTPVIEKVVKNAKGKVKLVKMNIDDHPQVAGQLGIQSIPAIVAFDKGQGVDGFMGALPENQILAFIEKLSGGKVVDEVAEALNQADAALIEGDAAGAMQIYAAIAQAEPDNIHACVGIARCQLEVGQVEAAETVLASIPAARQNDPAVAAVRAQIEVAKAAADLGPLHELAEKVAANPKDHQARFDLAIALNAKDRREEAVDHLLEIFRQDRAWNEDAARKQLVQFFEAWGPMDETTIAGRRKLSSLMFR